MKSSRFSFSLAAGALLSSLLLQAPAALAQVPPHRPGEICVTPKTWCWQKPAGKPGAPCSCPTPFGTLGGTLQ
ncbi:MAG: hypothetical protein ABI589_05785 [Burkholderiales bacterium]